MRTVQNSLSDALGFTYIDYEDYIRNPHTAEPLTDHGRAVHGPSDAALQDDDLMVPHNGEDSPSLDASTWEDSASSGASPHVTTGEDTPLFDALIWEDEHMALMLRQPKLDVILIIFAFHICIICRFWSST